MSMFMLPCEIWQETQQFITDLQQSSFLQFICNPIEDCVFAYICGSRLTGLANTQSDIDIVVVMKNNQSCNWRGHSLQYLVSPTKKIKVQWWHSGVENFFKNQGHCLYQSPLITIGMFQWGFISEDLIFYCNEKYRYILQNFLKHKHRVQQLGALKFIQREKQLIFSQSQLTVNWVNGHSPTIARLCSISLWLQGREITNTEQDFIFRIKRSHVKNVDLQQIQQHLLYLQQYQINNNIDLAQEEEDLINLMYEGGTNYYANN